MLDKTTTIEAFLEGAAAKQPTPGGGAVAALAGALAASMGEMVLNYSVGKLELQEPLLRQYLSVFHATRDTMLDLMGQDQSAYEALRSAKKLPADDPKRDAEIQSATKLCIEIPRRIAEQAVLVLESANEVVDDANRYLLSDLAVCAELAMATLRAAIYNVKVNLPGIADAQERQQIADGCEKKLSQAVVLIQRLIPRISLRAG